MAETIHGSTIIPAPHRRLAFPWYTGIHEDNSKLDMIEGGTWEEEAGAHWDFLIGPRFRHSGYPYLYGSAAEPFGGCVAVRGLAPICDALAGARKYTDFGVLSDVACRKEGVRDSEDRVSMLQDLVRPGSGNGKTSIWFRQLLPPP